MGHFGLEKNSNLFFQMSSFEVKLYYFSKIKGHIANYNDFPNFLKQVILGILRRTN